MIEIESDRKDYSLIGIVLGYLGLIPFLLGATSALILDPVPVFLEEVVIVYSTIILSFLGGIQWGLALCSEKNKDGRLILSVFSSLVPWFLCLIFILFSDLPVFIFYFFFGIFHLAQLFIDKKIFSYIPIASWYLKMRYKLAYTVSSCHLILMLLSLQ